MISDSFKPNKAGYFNCPVPKIKCIKFLVTVIALNILIATPIASVSANPFTIFEPAK